MSIGFCSLPVLVAHGDHWGPVILPLVPLSKILAEPLELVCSLFPSSCDAHVTAAKRELLKANEESGDVNYVLHHHPPC